jgi:hypothetical protein
MESNEPTERTMQIQRTSMTPSVDIGSAADYAAASSPGGAPAAARPTGTSTGGAAAAVERGGGTTKTEQAPRSTAPKPPKADPSVAAMSSADRAVVASATGFYIAPNGEVSPGGMPPWSFIMQTLERRHKSEAAGEVPQQPQAPTSASNNGSGAVDVHV